MLPHSERDQSRNEDGKRGATVGILVDYILDPASDIRSLEASAGLGLFNSFDAESYAYTQHCWSLTSIICEIRSSILIEI